MAVGPVVHLEHQREPQVGFRRVLVEGRLEAVVELHLVAEEGPGQMVAVAVPCNPAIKKRINDYIATNSSRKHTP